MSRRERKKAETRRALCEAALRLFEEQGYQHTTVEDITEAADVSRRTFFRYFPAKEAVAFPDRDRHLALFRESLAAKKPGDSNLDAVRRALLVLANEYAQNRARLVRQRRIIQSSPALEAYDFETDRLWEAALAHAFGDVARVSKIKRRRARLIAGAIMGLIRVLLQEWYSGDARGSLQTLADEGFLLLAHGFGDDEGDR